MEPDPPESSVMDPEEFQAYISGYSGNARISRAMFVAQNCKGTLLELEALRRAHDDIKANTANFEKYREVVAAINGRLGPPYELDQGWISAVERNWLQEKERLENDLAMSRNNMAKEGTRLANERLAKHFYCRGDLQNALKCYVRMRDYCNDSKGMLGMCMNVIQVSLEIPNVMHMTNHIVKAENLPDVLTPEVEGKLKAAAGLANLLTNKYSFAARRFTEVLAELGSGYSEVLTSRDVAVYGTLCALACFDRDELYYLVIKNLPFREVLEGHLDMREAVHDFYNSRYSACLARLEKMRPLLLCDIHLASHVTTLYNMVRKRALVQYSVPFISISLPSMAEAFNTDVQGMQKELEDLIGQGTVQARIDSQNLVMYARTTDQRRLTFQNALRAGESFQREARSLLVRGGMLQYDMVQRPSNNNQTPARGPRQNAQHPGSSSGGGGRRGARGGGRRTHH